MEAETFHLPLTTNLKLFGLSIKAGKIIFFKRYLMYVCLQWNVSPKFLLHSSARL